MEKYLKDFKDTVYKEFCKSNIQNVCTYIMIYEYVYMLKCMPT